MRAKHRATRHVGRLTKYNTLTGNTWGVLSPVFTRNHPPGTSRVMRAREYVMLGKQLTISAVLVLFGTAAAVAQSADLQELLNRMLRREEIESQQRFEDRQQERWRRQQEEAYDGRMCIAAGHAADSPDYYQCIRASAANRRGYGSPDFSVYGQPTAQGAQPRRDCVLLGDGLGGGIVDCN